MLCYLSSTLDLEYSRLRCHIIKGCPSMTPIVSLIRWHHPINFVLYKLLLVANHLYKSSLFVCSLPFPCPIELAILNERHVHGDCARQSDSSSNHSTYWFW